MTRVPVADVGQLMPYAVDTVSKVQSGGSGFGDSLKAAMDNHGNGTNSDKSMNVSRDNRSASDNSMRKVNESSTENDKHIDTQKKEEPKAENKKVTQGEKTEEVSEDVIAEVAQTTAQIVSEIAEVMNVTETEVIQAIDELGLEFSDLLDSSNMTDIITKISGAEDSISLLTDENLYSKLGELQEFVSASEQNLMNELDLSQEALNEILNQSEEPIETKTLSELNMLSEDMTQNPEVSIEGMKDYKVTTVQNGEEITTEVKVDDASGAQSVSAHITAQSTEEEQGNPSKENGEENKHSDADSEHMQVFSQELQKNNDINMPVENNFDEAMASRESEAGRIANQIMESMKINLKNEVSSLEMNLHPASLGSVRVNLTSQNGQITAQFIAQNETVRAAIESQVVQLTNQLEDQGIKVESVEVAVADHKFEHQGGENPGQNTPDRGYGKPKAGRIRRIDLSALNGEEDLEELEESDRIAAEMMAHNGNKVDYTA